MLTLTDAMWSDNASRLSTPLYLSVYRCARANLLSLLIDIDKWNSLYSVGRPGMLILRTIEAKKAHRKISENVT